MADAVETFLDTPLADGRSAALQALWHLAHGDWEAAHEATQASNEADSAWVHALLHRAEGDQGNALYWYRRAEKPVFSGSVEEERRAMLEVLLRSHTG